jgi:hypothetical protein
MNYPIQPQLFYYSIYEDEFYYWHQIKPGNFFFEWWIYEVEWRLR